MIPDPAYLSAKGTIIFLFNKLIIFIDKSDPSKMYEREFKLARSMFLKPFHGKFKPLIGVNLDFEVHFLICFGNICK